MWCVGIAGVGVGIVEDDGQRQAGETGGSEMRRVAANTAGPPAALLWRTMNGSLAPKLAVCAKLEGGRSGQPTSSSPSPAEGLTGARRT